MTQNAARKNRARTPTLFTSAARLRRALQRVSSSSKQARENSCLDRHVGASGPCRIGPVRHVGYSQKLK
jgi:hypothetical protein